MPGAGAGAPGADRRSDAGGLRRELGRWLLAPDFYREREVTAANWVEAAFEPAALAALVALFVAGVASFGMALAPDWDSRFLLPLCLVVALEAFFYARRLARPSLLLKEWAILLAPPVLALRLLPYLLGPDDLLADAARWLLDPWSLFTASFVANVVLLLLAWEMALDVTQDLNRLRVQSGELLADGDSVRRYEMYDASWRRVDHATPLRHIALRVLWGGVILTTLAALAALDVRQSFTPEVILQIVTFSRPAVSLAFANVVLYFAVGLLLLAEAQYVRQRTAWQVEELEAPRSLAPRWVAQAAVATAVVVGLALALPTDYALTISEALALLIAAVMQVVQLVVALAILVALAIMWPLRWLSPGGGEEAPAEPPPVLAPEPRPPAAPVPWLDVLQSLVFWLVVLVIVAYCLSVLWRRRPPLPAWLGAGLLGSLLGLLGAALAAARRLGKRAITAVVAALPRLRPAPPRPVRQAFRWLSLSRLGPRQLVEYFYLSTLERAARLGYARRTGETASEFSRRLPAQLPEVEPELSELTSTFLEARYSARPAEEGLVRAARAHWERLKRRLQSRRRLRERGERTG